jgi:hypothetical protein
MNKSVILFITAIIAFSLTGCWGTTTETNTETANANLQPDANAVSLKNVDINTVNNPQNTVNTNQQPMLEVQTNKVGNHIRTGEPGVDTEEFKKAETTRRFKLGPENSLISGEMNKDGNPVQRRKFSSHQMLDKVEVITYSADLQKQFVYLKDGKVLQIEPGKISNPMTASSYELLKAVGVELQTSPPTGNEKKDDQKQKGKGQ